MARRRLRADGQPRPASETRANNKRVTRALLLFARSFSGESLRRAAHVQDPAVEEPRPLLAVGARPRGAKSRVPTMIPLPATCQVRSYGCGGPAAFLMTEFAHVDLTDVVTWREEMVSWSRADAPSAHRAGAAARLQETKSPSPCPTCSGNSRRPYPEPAEHLREAALRGKPKLSRGDAPRPGMLLDRRATPDDSSRDLSSTPCRVALPRWARRSTGGRRSTEFRNLLTLRY